MALILSYTVAEAQTTVVDMRENCKTAKRALNNEPLSKNEQIDASYCIGYMQGIYDQRMSNCFAMKAQQREAERQDKNGTPDWVKDTLANSFVGFNVETIVQTFLNYADKHPERWNEWVPMTFDKAFSKFPCK